MNILLLFRDSESVLLLLFIGEISLFDGELFFIVFNVRIILLFIEWCCKLIKFLYNNYFIELFGYSCEVLIKVLVSSILFVVS